MLRPELPTGEELEQLLQVATIEFVSDPQNVHVDDGKMQIVLSAIFEMYSSDFIKELTRRGLSSERGVVDYVASVAPSSLQAELKSAVAYEVTFVDYDWAISKKK